MPMHSIVITLKSGKLQSFEIEDMTGACDDPTTEAPIAEYSGRFADKGVQVPNCPKTDCSSSVNSTGICDPKIFISWIGTDSDDNTLISASNKLSNFKKYNMKGMYEAILKVNTNNHSDPDKSVGYVPANVDDEVLKRLSGDAAATDGSSTTNSGSNTNTTSSSGTTGTASSTDSTTSTSNTSGGTSSSTTSASKSGMVQALRVKKNNANVNN